MYLSWAHGLEHLVTGSTSWAEGCDLLPKGHSALSTSSSSRALDLEPNPSPPCCWLPMSQGSASVTLSLAVGTPTDPSKPSGSVNALCVLAMCGWKDTDFMSIEDFPFVLL